MSATRNISMLPVNQPIFTPDKDDRMYRTRHYPPSPPITSHPSTPLMSSASTSSSRRASMQAKTPWYSGQNTSLRPLTQSIPSPNMSKQDEDNTPFFNLEKVVQQYGEQRDLLELILSSKVEEDRRRAEEAKLRQKEIDYLLQQHRQDAVNVQRASNHSWKSKSAIHLSPDRSSYWPDNARRFSDVGSVGSILPRIQSPPPHQAISCADSAANHSTEVPGSWRNGSSPEPRPRFTERRKSSNNIDSLLSHSPKSVSATLPPISTTSPSPAVCQQPSPFNIPSLNQVTDVEDRSSSTSDSPLSPLDIDGDTNMSTQRHQPHQIEPRQVYQPMLPSFHRPDKLPILPATSRRVQRPVTRRRRRREMQAISTIIETREFPYNDDYLWKNNGNTVHKKSGFRSIYYKCSNSAKGCPVNKTVTFKEHGNYLIKYRGEHLDECNRIKRIVDV
ncbi:hypothetical protein BJV82DRAFT_618776 [Fennellomyces sp. T-0311]|nr:hypothetical protein BJV82DRAFT_618776 [Fennellomyces sp. T-0311]